MRLAMPALTVVVVALVAGCSSSDESDPPANGRSEMVTTGAVDYDDSGDIDAFELDYAGVRCVPVEIA